MAKQSRNRAYTTQRIVDGLETILAQEGWSAVSINRVADMAGISKVLIYRYFGGVTGLFAYYIRSGKLLPQLTPDGIEQIRPFHESDLAPIWSHQVLQTFRSFRTLRAGQQIIKATVVENDETAQGISQNFDAELTRLVNQLSFVEGADTPALAAVVLGGLSYLTILAQNHKPMLGIDLQSEAGWERIEQAVRLIYKALGKSAIASPQIHVQVSSLATNAATIRW